MSKEKALQAVRKQDEIYRLIEEQALIISKELDKLEATYHIDSVEEIIIEIGKVLDKHMKNMENI